jgi:hypothetical protein
MFVSFCFHVRDKVSIRLSNCRSFYLVNKDDLLLLKRGGRVVFFGELGQNCNQLVRYFEERGGKAISRGENPANWVLSVVSVSSETSSDYATVYEDSDGPRQVKGAINEWKENPDPQKKISYSSEYACSTRTRGLLTNHRLAQIYWRSPAYNLSRMSVSAIIALVLGSVLIKERDNDVFTETQMRARLAVIFLSFIIVGIMSIVSVLPVMLSIRDMFYRHRASGMVDSKSLGWALGSSEKGFILVSSTIFCIIFLGVAGADRGLLEFWVSAGDVPSAKTYICSSNSLLLLYFYQAFFTFNLAIYSYFGQAFVCLFRSMATAQILASVFIGINNFFSGLIVRPQFLTGFFEIPYWITPGHYVYEGMVTALFSKDNGTVIADPDSDFYNFIDCPGRNITEGCTGTISQFVDIFFGERFSYDNRLLDYLVLGFCLVLARLLTFLALTYINFSST